jgi:hypothetical protein
VKFVLREPLHHATLYKYLADPVTGWEAAALAGKPLQVIVEPEKKKRSLSANARYWARPLKDIERDATYDGQHYRAELWHEHASELFLPDEAEFDFDPSHVTDPDTYRKWEYPPMLNRRRLIGSTTQLTPKGFSIYLEKVQAHFSARPYCVTFTEREP